MNALLNNLYKLNDSIFAKSRIEKNYPVIEFSGVILDEKKYPEDLILNIEKNKYIGPSGSFDDYIKHSCNPNCKVKIVKNRAFLYSIKVIRVNEEITFDYSTVIPDKEYKENCHCKQFNCSKKIESILNNKEKYKKYLLLDMIPKFMEIND